MMVDALLFTVTLFAAIFAITLVLKIILEVICFIIDVWEEYTDMPTHYLIFVAIFLFIFLGSRYIAKNPPDMRNCITVYVSTVGGCDELGVCGVTYSDGSFGSMSYPTVGKSDQICN